jgi:hypothetical protein
MSTGYWLQWKAVAQAKSDIDLFRGLLISGFEFNAGNCT